MTLAKTSPLFVTKDLLETRYHGAEVIFVAGSVMRGEATAYSDIDIVVIFPKIQKAYRESFYHMEWPVEAFVHDPDTLQYFFHEIDRPTGTATLAEMVYDGIEVPQATPFSENLKSLAAVFLREGPPKLSQQEIEDRRYHLSERLDDLRDPRSKADLYATASAIYAELAEYYFRSRNEFSSTGKAILKRMKKSDPNFMRRFMDAFETLYTQAQPGKVIELCEELLMPQGGLLFDKYRRDAEGGRRR
jgi:predicted nucleotidyltransferase